MLIKFRTPIVSVAFKVSRQFPPELRKRFEHELQLVINLFSAAAANQETYMALWKKFHEYAHEQISNCPEINTLLSQPCDDWSRGLRTPQGACTNCGGKH